VSEPRIMSTRKPLPFGDLSPLEFERMCLWLVEREGYLHPQHLGEAGGEQGRDVIAYRLTGAGEELWYFQCKRRKRIDAATLKEEVDKYDALARADSTKRPAGIVFVTSAVASARVRDEMIAYCRERGYSCDFWARTELDMRVKRHPEVIQEFFDAGSEPPEGPPVPVPRRAWALVALLVLDFCLAILWGWCLFGHQPNLVAYLGAVFTIVAVPLAILVSIFVVRRPVALEEALCRLGAGRGTACAVLGLSGLAVVVTTLFWPLGWIGKCGPTATPACPLTAATDTEVLFALIDAEAQAVLDEDIELIGVIFAPDAVICNEATGEEWDGPEMYYAEKFRNEIHCRIEHYDHRVVKLTDTEAWVSTGNRGEWGWEGTGCMMVYENPPGADQWHFRKDGRGCWRVVRFTYNAHPQ
jgi:hypothetical protein